MNISIITVFPEIYNNFLQTSLIARAQEMGLVKFNIVKFSDYCLPKERIDEPVCGPGAGMIIKPEIIKKAIESCEAKWGKASKVFFSPQGKKLNQFILKEFASNYLGLSNQAGQTNHQNENPIKTDSNHMILVCSRYEGIDERVESFYADEVVSIGDYVLMGGDLPAQVFLEGFLRLLPGVVGKIESTQTESFDGPFLDYPEYGLPVLWEGQEIPDIVRSGNHKAIDLWREDQAAKKTIFRRFDWFRSYAKNKKDYKLAKKFIPNHYVALLHTHILVKGGMEGDTSITSIDIHDIARSSATYGIENYFIVSRFTDQHAILDKFLSFWKQEKGQEYNPSRYRAVSRVLSAYNLDEVVACIEEKEGKKPLIVATSAQESSTAPVIDYSMQGELWKQDRPILFIFGTGQGLSDFALSKSDYLLLPVGGLSDFNHLSVRSAVAIILDRWLGLQPKLYAKK